MLHSIRNILARASLPLAIIMLVGWGIWTFGFEAPGWVHLLLTLGVFFLIWHVVLRGTPDARTAEPRPMSRR
ncbi:MAG TPA: hypothetical protein VFK13_03235 [Gemmatimonadaceae bacterium]|jgi:hypothetical protein|nr:hypothetical protein [Gemmatimonadaceae bacterium]